MTKENYSRNRLRLFPDLSTSRKASESRDLSVNTSQIIILHSVHAIMALRVSSKYALHRVLWSAVGRPRQFTCTAVRVKDVVAQEPPPNMRHAIRPRTTSLPIS